MSTTQKRPAGNGANPEQSAGGRSTSSVPRPGDIASLARRHDFGLLVVAERRDGVLVSQVFASLEAAERKITRTRERGLSASMTLVRLVPVPHVVPEDLALVGGV